MSALNSNETDDLRKVKAVLEVIKRKGFDPESDDPIQVDRGKALEGASKIVHTVVQMKGYYPK